MEARACAAMPQANATARPGAVIPAQAGIHPSTMGPSGDSRLRGNDGPLTPTRSRKMLVEKQAFTILQCIPARSQLWNRSATVQQTAGARRSPYGRLLPTDARTILAPDVTIETSAVYGRLPALSSGAFNLPKIVETWFNGESLNIADRKSVAPEPITGANA